MVSHCDENFKSEKIIMVFLFSGKTKYALFSVNLCQGPGMKVVCTIFNLARKIDMRKKIKRRYREEGGS